MVAHRLPLAPRTRADCLPGGVNAQRPCPWLRCRFNLLSDLRKGRPTPRESCTLDVTDANPDGTTETAIAELLGGGPRQTIQKCLESALRKLRDR